MTMSPEKVTHILVFSGAYAVKALNLCDCFPIFPSERDSTDDVIANESTQSRGQKLPAYAKFENEDDRGFVNVELGEINKK